MAIKDTSRKPFIQDNDANVKVGIDLPIAAIDEISFMVKDFYLKESTLTKERPIYKDINRYKLSS